MCLVTVLDDMAKTQCFQGLSGTFYVFGVKKAETFTPRQQSAHKCAYKCLWEMSVIGYAEHYKIILTKYFANHRGNHNVAY